MAGVNKVIIIGRLGKKPELRSFDNGNKLANLSVATSESWTDKQTGEKRELTEWHNVVLNNRLAEIADQYLDKGSQVYIEGKLRTEKWKDQSGYDRYTTKIIGNSLQMLSSRDSGNSEQAGGKPQQNATQAKAMAQQYPMTDDELADFDDDIPF